MLRKCDARTRKQRKARTLRERRLHGAGDVDQKDGVSSQPRSAPIQRAKHRLLQRLLPLRRVPCRRQKTERQHAIGLQRRQCAQHQVLADAGLLHVTQVAERVPNAAAPAPASALRPALPRGCAAGQDDSASKHSSACSSLPFSENNCRGKVGHGVATPGNCPTAGVEPAPQPIGCAYQKYPCPAPPADGIWPFIGQAARSCVNASIRIPLHQAGLSG